MNSDKLTGSFYTPTELVDYMVNYLQNRVTVQKVLEPSAGDGRFISQLKNTFNCDICAVEIDIEKVKKIKLKYPDISVICGDFLDFTLQHKEKYDLIIGNPPYISKKNLGQTQRDKSIEILTSWDLSESLFQNMWVSFLVGALNLLNDEGAIFLVLPFEFLQVQYAEGLREFLETKFNTIEIVTFSERIFQEVEQDTCLVFLSNEQEGKAYVKYITLNNLKDSKIEFESVIMRNKPIKKWSNCIINDNETESLKSFAARYQTIDNFGDISPGIVTGANSFFIVCAEVAQKLNLPESILLPIISKSNDLSNKFVFTKKDFETLSNAGKRVWMLNLSTLNDDAFSEETKAYLESGKKEDIHKRYKCKQRSRWYDVPIIRSGKLSFFKRYNIFPRMIVNEAAIHTTDIAYNIRVYEGIDAASLAFCFYNSLTLTLCEYHGRFYGGGVGELIPSEFKSLSIPYKYMKKQPIEKVNQMMQDRVSFSKIIDYVDSQILDLALDEINLLQDIRERYLRRRLPL